MNIELLQEYIEQGLSSYQIAAKTNKAATTVRYWIKKHGLSISKPDKPDNHCARCDTVKTRDDFYQYDTKRRTTYCKPCMASWMKDRCRKLKALAVEYAGGCCKGCGYDKYQGALDFHHRDPAQKDFSIAANMRRGDLSETMKAEIDKCVLLCANCHREAHGGLRDWKMEGPERIELS
jgi:hypothetical protein